MPTTSDSSSCLHFFLDHALRFRPPVAERIPHLRRPPSTLLSRGVVPPTYACFLPWEGFPSGFFFCFKASVRKHKSCCFPFSGRLLAAFSFLSDYPICHSMQPVWLPSAPTCFSPSHNLVFSNAFAHRLSFRPLSTTLGRAAFAPWYLDDFFQRSALHPKKSLWLSPLRFFLPAALVRPSNPGVPALGAAF